MIEHTISGKPENIVSVNEIERHLKLLKVGFVEGEDLIEIRDINGGVRPNFFKTFREAVDHCASVSGTMNLYVVFNPIKRDISIPPGRATSDNDIECRRWLMFDFDVQQSARNDDRDRQSTPEQKARTYASALNFVVDMQKFGWDDPLITDSGNGTKLFYRTALPNSDDVNVRLKALYDILGELYSDDMVKFDVSVKNPARVERVCGTLNLKGEGKPGYEERMSHIIKEPERTTVVSTDMIQKVIDQYTRPEPVVEEVGALKNLETVKRILGKLGIGITRIEDDDKDFAYKVFIDRCVNAREHTGKSTGTDTAILILKNGAIAYKCQHSHCVKLSWQDVRKLAEPDYTPHEMSIPHSDLLFSEQFADDQYLRTIYCADSKTWYQHNGKYWQPAADDAIRSIMIEFLKKRHAEELENADRDVDRTPRQKIDRDGKPRTKEGRPMMETGEDVEARVSKAARGKTKYLFKLMDTNMSTPMTLAKSNPKLMVAIDQLDADNNLFALADGNILDTRTCTIMTDRLENRKRYMTGCCTAKWNPSAQCPKYRAIMERVFPDEETRIAVRSFIGYILSGDNLQYYFLFYGQSGTGKGTFFNVLFRWFGSYAEMADDEAFLLNKNGTGNMFGLSNIINKRLVGLKELPVGREYNWPRIKSFTSKDPQCINVKHKPLYTAFPKGVLVMQSNHEPTITPEEVESVERRQKIIPFLAKQEVDNPDIVDEIVNEEADGLLNEFMDCIRLYREKGVLESKLMRDMMKRWSNANKPVKFFMLTIIEPCPDSAVDAADVYDDYVYYCRALKENPVGRNTFYGVLKTEGYVIDRTYKGNVIVNVKRKKPHHSPELSDSYNAKWDEIYDALRANPGMKKQDLCDAVKLHYTVLDEVLDTYKHEWICEHGKYRLNYR